MNLRRPRNYENDFIGASVKYSDAAIEAPAILRFGIAGRFLELALYHSAVQPAASFLLAHNPQLLGGLGFRFAGAIGSDA
jgi:hypothetical protein